MASPDNKTLDKIEAIGAALAVASPAAKSALQREYLELVGHFLSEQGRGDKLAFPMLDLIEVLEVELPGVLQAPAQKERREALAEASDGLLARVSAVIDVLISAGYSLEHACQIVTRQMIARGVRPPRGGDARAWRNVQAWRHKLLNTRREGAIWNDYSAFKDAIMQSYGTGVADAAKREALWERRHLTQG